jgi:hypothetical protein
VTDHDIQAAIDRYDYFLTELYHERALDYEDDLDCRYGDDWTRPD